MRQLQWNKLPDGKVKDTMWDKDIKDDDVKLDKLHLERLFGVGAAGGPGGMPAVADAEPGEESSRVAKKEGKKELVTLLDPKTSNNTSIAISRFKLTPQQIKAALLSGDETVFQPEQLAALLPILPSAEDKELVESYDGPKELLGKAEAFFLEIVSVPRYVVRTRCMLLRATFTERVGELNEAVQCVGAAAKQIRVSPLLRVLLQQALALGNFLNGGSAKGAAWGFKLTSLDKLQAAKTCDGKSTLLHYLANILDQRKEGFVRELMETELKDVKAAACAVWAEEGAELQKLLTEVKQVETQVQVDKVEAFKAAMGTFYESANKEAQLAKAAREKADASCVDVTKWLGEDSKTKPEDIFSTLHNFMLTLHKAHKYNVECADRDRKKKQALDAASTRKASVPAKSGPAKAGVPALPRARPVPGGGSGSVIDNELAAKLARRNQRNLVDGVAEGMANGTLMSERRQQSFARHGKKAAL